MSEFIQSLPTETLKQIEIEAEKEGIADALFLVQSELSRRALEAVGFYDASEDIYEVQEHHDELWAGRDGVIEGLE